MRTRLLLCLAVLGCISANAQSDQPFPVAAPPPPPFQQVRAYLALTDAQFTQLIQHLSDFTRFVSQRQQRMFQVQSEITDETAKIPLDPPALGIRYAEIETICRNVNDESAAVQTRNLALLTDAQKLKLKALEDAYKLLPAINDAQNAGLLSPPGSHGSTIRDALPIDTSSFVAPIVNLSGCQQPAVANINTGNFTGAP